MNWCQAVQQMVKDDPKASVVLLEIGVGLRLPKVPTLNCHGDGDLSRDVS